MGTIIGQFTGGVIIALQLIMIVYLVITLDKSSLPERGQEISNLTGLPTWINVLCPSPQPEEPEVKGTSLEYASSFFTGVASLVCIHRLRKKNRTNKRTWDTVVDAVNRAITSDKPTDWSMFDAIITVYVTITFLVLVVGNVFSVGKLWAIFGIFHNVIEVFIIAALLRLTLDFMIPVLFSIVAYENHVQSHESLDQIESLGENQPLIVKTNSRLKGLGYLIFAALVHLIGNVSDVVGNDSKISIAIFQLSYFVAFPIYGYYVYKDKEDKDKPVKPIQANITVFDFILLFLWGITASGISILIGIKELRCP
ncbi:hypothetical protein C1646_793102 [Rhizophagus diaphanus]|nr:hypothetical protein C1646_793102 [Rhizophagus diaphanus] [Rhizophagus sp. MUCL 43196]